MIVNEDKFQWQSLVDKNHAALKFFFDKYYTFLTRVSLSIVQTESEAEDVVQEIFIKLWDMEITSEIDNPQGFLYQMVKNKSLTVFNQNNRLRDKGSLHQLSQTNYVNQTEEALNYKELIDKVNEVLLKLPPKCSDVFQLIKLDGLSYKETAERLGISIKTVENQMGKALKVVRNEMSLVISIVLFIFLLSQSSAPF